ncbi:MFS transporter [Streptomyces sp. NPDC014894]|uniref:MFS transporter n=1 Tax=Streptomyces sp. NPDC014894 TaxID=3364931 RepID=UPI0036F88BCE
MATSPAPTASADSSPPGRSVLRDTAFLRLWAGTTASGLATWSLPFVLGLAVLHQDLSASGLGLVLAGRTVGFLAAVAVGGVLADRHSRRTVVLLSALIAAAASPLLAAGLGRSLTLMTVGAVLAGAGQGACRPAFQALTADVVAPENRQRANAAMTLAVRVTTLAGPALTALLAAFTDVRTLLWGIGLLWAVAAFVPGKSERAAGAASASGQRASFRREFMEGIAEARRHPWFVAGLAALTTVVALGYSATSVALPLISRDRYGTEWVLAAAVTAYTLGALGGALVIAGWRPRAQGWVALAGLAAYGFAPLSLMLPVHPAVVIAAYVVAGVGIELFNVPWFTATQREVAPDRLARVSSLDFLLSYGLAPLGLALIAPAMDAFGVTAVLATCALACFLAPAAAALTPSSRRFARAPSETG